MAATSADSVLGERLERLTGEDAACCLPEYAALAVKIRGSKAFPLALRRAKALADENRLLVAAFLKRRGEQCACEVQAATGLTHATVSHHMALLGAAGLVAARRQGKWMYYRLTNGEERGIP